MEILMEHVFGFLLALFVSMGVIITILMAMALFIMIVFGPFWVLIEAFGGSRCESICKKT